ncbi:hypothetical protein [Bradyrhizobium sp. BR 1433]|uniref:hypothetical protein n=1 Tax=Bradyrhizobium sp. BR 1433 TaxID=3447967 RepID=UPI003EE71FBF
MLQPLGETQFATSDGETLRVAHDDAIRAILIAGDNGFVGTERATTSLAREVEAVICEIPQIADMAVVSVRDVSAAGRPRIFVERILGLTPARLAAFNVPRTSPPFQRFREPSPAIRC